MKITEIELVFENCEVLWIDLEYHDVTLSASEITESVFANGGDVRRMKCAGSVQIILPYSLMSEKTSEETTLADKILQNDIASVVLIYDDNSEEQIYVPWDEDEQNSDFTNDYQHNEFLNTCIVVNINDKYPRNL